LGCVEDFFVKQAAIGYCVLAFIFAGKALSLEEIATI